MPRRDSSRRPSARKDPPVPVAPVVPVEPEPAGHPEPPPIRPRLLWLVVAGLLAFHYLLAASPWRRENPTVDEVNHLPAGVSYWQTGTFRLYHHNPPLVKLVAALPVLLRGVETAPLYRSPIWRSEPPSQADFGKAFLYLNADRYFELFGLAQAILPVFSIAGGLAVFLWSRRLWGDGGGLLSLFLWCVSPNLAAHARLVTSDVPAAAMAVVATHAFWRYLHQPRWGRAALAGIVLGLAQLTKFSLLLLYGIWPLLWLIREVALFDRSGSSRRLARSAGQGALIVLVSVLVIDAGYGFEGVGRKLGSFPFASRSFLTRPGITPARSRNELIDISWRHRVNRFRGTAFASWPSPLPSEYLLGFDEQKVEADALPLSWFDTRVTDPSAVTGYPVFLDGVLRRHGWRDYYARALLYKTPEGTLLLVVMSLALLLISKARRLPISDEAAIYAPPILVFTAMSFFTDINLGVRYVLPVLPFFFIGCGRVVPWMTDDGVSGRMGKRVLVGASAAASLLATLSIFPHPIAYFNWASGGPDRTPPRLIDSNLDWGQDLIGLRDWMATHEEKVPIGLAYFGQVPPDLFERRGEGFAWFLPPMEPGTKRPMVRDTTALRGPAPRLTPGLYAVSVSLAQGLPWRVYDPSPAVPGATWNALEDAFGYFRLLSPFERIGHSILLYRVTPEEAARINSRFLGVAMAAASKTGMALASGPSPP